MRSSTDLINYARGSASIFIHQSRRVFAGGSLIGELEEGRLAPVCTELLPALPPAARMPQAIDAATSHLGFRCTVRHPKFAGK